MENMVYIPVCRGWSINGAAQWDVIACPTSKAYKYSDELAMCDHTLTNGAHLYSTEVDAWAWIADRWHDVNHIDLDSLPDWHTRNKRGAQK
jgi:hypothetical protein